MLVRGETGRVTHVGRSAESAAPFTIELDPVNTAESRAVLDSYVQELGERFGQSFDTSRSAPPAPGDFEPPAGAFLLVRSGGRVLGCGALRTEVGGTAEIRRMWVSPELRGQGAGRALLAALEEQARVRGCRKVRLDTAAELSEARTLYASAGYVEIPAYNDNEYAAHWFEKQLEIESDHA